MCFPDAYSKLRKIIDDGNSTCFPSSLQQQFTANTATDFCKHVRELGVNGHEHHREGSSAPASGVRVFLRND